MVFRISKLERAQRNNPRAPLFARLAHEHLRRSQAAHALALCLEGCERFPTYPTGFLILSRCHEAQGSYEEARSALAQALRLDPENPAGFAQLSAIYEQLGETALSFQCMQQAALLEPYSETLKREVGRLRELQASARTHGYDRVAADKVSVEADAARAEVTDEGAGAEVAPDPASTDPASIDLASTVNAESGPDRKQRPSGADDSDIPGEGLFDEGPMDEVTVDGDDGVREPFAAVQPLPEWDEAQDRGAGAVPGDAADTDVSLATDDTERDGSSRIDGPERAHASEGPGSVDASDEVAALGIDLFGEDESADAESGGEGRLAPDAEPPLSGDPAAAAVPQSDVAADVPLDLAVAPPHVAAVPPHVALGSPIAQEPDSPEPHACAASSGEPLGEATKGSDSVSDVGDLAEPIDAARTVIPAGQEATVPADQPGEVAAEPAEERSPPPVARFASRDCREFVDLLAELNAGGRATSGSAIPDGTAECELEAPVATVTLAELYSQQGVVQRAIETYREVLLLRPEDEEIVARLAALQQRGESFTRGATRGEDG